MDLRMICLALACGACASHVEPSPRASAGEVPPTNPAELDEWLRNADYAAWERWSEVGPTLGSGGARVFLSPSLVESLRTGGSLHPVGAAAVRELYADDFATLSGYSVLIKVEPIAEAASWFCFERLALDPGSELHVAELGAPGCSGCHARGTDFVQSTLPLP